MTILKNQELDFCKLDPKSPDKNKLDPTKPSWLVKCITTSKAQKKEWTDLGIKVKTVRQDKDDDESPVLHYSVYFRKGAQKKDKLTEEVTKAAPPEVVDGKNRPVDGATVGKGSIANLRLLPREYDAGGIKKMAYTLMAVQLVKHVVYVGRPMEEFDECETETVMPPEKPDESDDADLY